MYNNQCALNCIEFNEDLFIELKMRMSRCHELMYRMSDILKETDNRLTDLDLLLRPFCAKSTLKTNIDKNVPKSDEIVHVDHQKINKIKRKGCILQ